MREGWEVKKLGDISKIVYGYTEKASIEEIGPKFLRITDIENTGVNWSTVPYCKITQQEYNKYKLVDGDIVFARTGATTGKSFLVKNPPKSVFASYLIKLNVNKEIFLSEFLMLFFQTETYWNIINEGISGSAQGGFNATKLGNLSISFPNLDEQRNIISTIHRAFSIIELAKSNTERNLQNAKKLFESYLQSVFENKGEGWEEKTLGDKELLEIIDGDRGKNYPTEKDFSEEGYCLFMNTKNVRPDGLEFKSKMFINEAKDKTMGKGKLQRNDVVMTTRGTIGNIGIFNVNVPFDNIRINSGMLIFRPNPNFLSSEFLFEVFRSSIMKDQIAKHVSGAAQPQLPIRTLVNFKIPIPKTLEDQNIIVNNLKVLLKETKKLESIYQKKLADLEELKKSILQKAFSGELTAKEVVVE